MARKKRQANDAICWERARAIFGNAPPPVRVWQSQFDYCDDDLKRLASTAYREIDRGDLWCYYHDLAYVELQEDLFNYLFPVCLMQWHDTLLRDESCSQGDAEFHYGMREGQVFQKMLTPRQQGQVTAFFRDSFLERLDREPATVEPSRQKHPFRWICRFNSLGFVIPSLAALWEPWWRMETRGRVIAVLKYCSGLVCLEGENRYFGIEWAGRGWFGPHLWEHDSNIHEQSWLEPNIRFIRGVITFDYLAAKVAQAVEKLHDQPQRRLAEQLSADLVANRELVESRAAELPRLLAGERITADGGWSI